MKKTLISYADWQKLEKALMNARVGYEIMMTDNPREVFDTFKWDWESDYKWLIKDAMETFSIQEVPVFDIMGIKE